MTDGTITIDTTLKTDKFDKQIANLEKKMQNAEKKKLLKETQIQGLEKEINDYDLAIEKATEYKSELQRLRQVKSDMLKQNQFLMTTPTQEYRNIESQIQGATAGLSEQNTIIQAQERSLERNYVKLEQLRNEHKEITNEVNEYKGQIETLGMQKQQAEVKKLSDSFKGVGSSIQGAIAKAGKLALGIFGIRSAYMMMRRAASDLASYDPQFAADLEYIRFILTQAVAPVLRWIVQMAMNLLAIIGAITEALFGVNIFSNGSAENFQKMKSGAGGATKAVKELKKQLMGFDEVNVLTDQSDTGTTGGGVGGITMPTWDVGEMIEKAKAFVENAKGMWKDLGKTIEDALNDPRLFDGTFGNWGMAIQGLIRMAQGAYDIISGFIEGIGGILQILYGLLTGDMDKVQEGFNNLINGLWKMIKGLGELIAGIVEFVFGIIVGVLLDISDFFGWLIKTIWDGITSVAKWIIEKFQQAIDFIYNRFIKPVGEWFANLWTKITNIFAGVGDWFYNKFQEARMSVENAFWGIVDFIGGIWNNIVNTFSTIGGYIGEALGGSFRGAINGAIRIVENLINRVVGGINGAIGLINQIPGVSIGYLSRVNLPRMATGAIVNMPGRGTLIGRGIGGENGREGVLPLTDRQAMEELGATIGKYITINANILNNMNGRTISRELKKVQANQDFAYNT